MGRKRKPGFREPRMLSSRVEFSDFCKFEDKMKRQDGKTLQEMLNLFVVNYISGNIYLKDDKFYSKNEE